ncbi:MAG: acyltransferase [Deltaproteobacteria bacterium]|jgi:1-acyl-sn-glycerol-3-phosphate acyltransferase|nr:acyltransferase [Deltaproteobacteria bacterium]MBT4264788.1 acyltransferase [Deltaproteobacteria bacterium]MBT4639250.1 acyltransferase [Deltaproteobacteria bacterium]MBT6502330.1 acyltransferase [Deltaproteobacteria bacterium]MBT6614633.1 acyltransferase [Deltaproteobacteria bacterium]
MLKSIPGHVRGVFMSFLLLFNLFFWLIFLMPFMIIKIILPVRMIRLPMDVVLNWMCTVWASGNDVLFKSVNKIQIDVKGAEELSMKDWYLVLSNHQSWADIIILQSVLNNQIPYFRFFLKKELAWIPMFNLVWYALDYPYMKRYSKSFLEKYPHLKGKDIETTKKSCARFKDTPVSIMNFVEGTRFTNEKQRRQKSTFTHLLKPKAGGVAFVLAAMGDQLTSILDVTICYSPKVAGFWDYICGRVGDIKVRVSHLPITEELKGDYYNDPAFKERFQHFVNRIWLDKDRLLTDLNQS